MNPIRKNLSEKQFEEVVDLFKKRGYNLLNSPICKVRKFEGAGLPTVFIERRGKRGPYTNKLMIHPCIDRKLFRFHLEDNNHAKKGSDPKLFSHSNVSPFPALLGKTRNCLKVLFDSNDQLGEILDNLLEIEQHKEAGKTTTPKTSETKPSEDLPEPNAEAMSDLYTPVKTEGKKKLAFTYRYERDKALREQALKEFGYSCAVCGMTFLDRYGEIGRDFIEVHHKVPISEGEQESNYKNLVPLCSNCHKMIHRLYKELKPSEYENAVELLKGRLS